MSQIFYLGPNFYSMKSIKKNIKKKYKKNGTKIFKKIKKRFSSYIKARP